MDIITSHLHADFDALASMVAAGLLYPEATLVFPGSQEKGVREFLAQAPLEITDRFARLKNIDLSTIRRLIIVDTRQRSRIGPFADIIDNPDVEVIIHDHHPAAADDLSTGHQQWRELGAATTLLVELLEKADITPTPLEASVLAMGIYEDTGGLLFPSTTPDDCRAYGTLLGWGADPTIVSRAISSELTPEQVNVLDQLIKNAQTLDVGGIEVLVTTSESRHYVEDFAMLVHKLRDMYPVDATFALGLMSERIYLVGRSALPQLDAGRVTSHFGGGGHATAAAASLKDCDLAQTRARLLKAIKTEARPRIIARDLMTFPVKTLPPSATLDEASAMLNRYNINAAVITTASGRIMGLVTRQVVTRAQGHGLGQAPTRDYMIRDLRSVHPEAPISLVRTLVIDGRQRLLPVVKDHELLGVITRTDLMMFLHERMTSLEEGPRPTPARTVRSLLNERLPAELLTLLRQAGELAEETGCHVYLVGGIVRDLMLRIDNLDVDLVVEGDGLAFARSFARHIGARVAIHEKYKTAVIILPDGGHLDVATARLEYYPAPGSFPVVEDSTLKLDLYRRDFTINTMAVALNPGRYGELIDFFGALRDIREKRVRVLHALSFVEDPSRILRAVRFEQRYGFHLSRQAISLIHAAVKAGFLQGIPGRRISHEMKQLLMEAAPDLGMARLQELGVLHAIHPDFIFNESSREALLQARDTVSWFALLYTHEEIRPWFIYILVLVDGLKPKKVAAICTGLGLSTAEINRIIAGRHRSHEIIYALTSLPAPTPAAVSTVLEREPLEEMLFVMSRAKNQQIKELISTFITTWRNYRPPLNGQDLKRLGFAEGRALGHCLSILRERGLNGDIRDLPEALDIAKAFLAAHPEAAARPADPA